MYHDLFVDWKAHSEEVFPAIQEEGRFGLSTHALHSLNSKLIRDFLCKLLVVGSWNFRKPS